ncbi:hypothetical protein HBI17_206500 [Parastagonospora nodorum]|nr:hypothetical protein HBI17_206500 [Parastagonospora nodorum]
MVIKKTRGATKKLGPISLGHKTTRVQTRGNDKRTFVVHEDLVCAHSRFFKKKLQNVRKPLEGECSICHEEFDPCKGDIAFCQGSCGQNIHNECIQQWSRTQRAGSTTCPMCRKPWVMGAEDLITLDSELDPDAVQIYLDWLYTGQLHISEAITRESDEFNIQLLKAWIVSEAFGDRNFRKDIIVQHYAAIDEDDNWGFRLDAIEFAFEDDDHDYMQSFVVDSVHAHADWDAIDDDIDNYPHEFVRKLCLAGIQFKQNQGTTAKDDMRENWE